MDERPPRQVDTQLLERMLHAAEHERMLLATQLHNGPIQHLASFGYTLDRIERRLVSGQLDAAIELLRTVRKDMTIEVERLRRLMSDGQSSVLDEREVGGDPVGLGPLPEKGTGPSVLVVDDEPSVRSVLVAVLGDHDFDVVGQGANGAEAIELVERLRPDLVLMDLRMPVMGGREAARLILELDPTIVIVLLSGDDDRAEVADCLALGVFDLIAKGGRANEICDSLSAAWRHAQALRGPA